MKMTVKDFLRWLPFIVSGMLLTEVLSTNDGNRIRLLAAGVISIVCWWYWKKNSRQKNDISVYDTVIIALMTLLWLGYNSEMYVARNESLFLSVSRHTHIFDLLGNSSLILIRLIVILVCFHACFFVVREIYTFITGYLRHILQTLNKVEKLYLILYVGIFSILLLIVFLKTNVFYDPGNNNVIFTFDSHAYISKNVYMNMGAPENDLRQPLYAFFSLPISLEAYFLSNVANWGGSYAYFIQLFLAVVIALTNIMIERILLLTEGLTQIAFFVYVSALYSVLLFTFMVEQYQILVFWIVLFLYMFTKNKDADMEADHLEKMAMVGAIGTFVVNAWGTWIVLTESRSIKRFIIYCVDIIKWFLLLCICLGRFSILSTSIQSFIKLISDYTGVGGVPIGERILQYFYFLHNIFIAPSTLLNYDKFPAVDMVTVDSISLVGCFVFGVAICSAVINRDKIATRFMSIWMAFSFILLCLLGWCTSTNDVIVHIYYFGWAFSAMVFIFLNQLIKNKKILLVLTCSASAVMIFVNLSSILEIISFGINSYPIA